MTSYKYNEYSPTLNDYNPYNAMNSANAFGYIIHHSTLLIGYIVGSSGADGGNVGEIDRKANRVRSAAEVTKG